MTDAGQTANSGFVLEEATIADLHGAIRAGETTCVEVVQHYLARVRAYNGVASRLVTGDGAPVRAATGTVRAGAPVQFPTTTVNAADILPDLEHYQGPPLELGRMQATASDPAVVQQLGMITGIPGGTQLNALSTLNIRGERSVTCRGDFDRHPSNGPLPPGAPPVCEFFRHQPDALERAAALDATYGRNPDLAAMPMYGVVFSFKDPFDTRDMRSTGAAMLPTTSIFRHATTSSSSSCARRARSSSPRRYAPNTTVAPAIRAVSMSPRTCCRQQSATSDRRGAATRPTCTIPCARRHSGPAPAAAFR